ncbi:DUF6131 family protein [Streptomyces sp. NPDC046324]
MGCRAYSETEAPARPEVIMTILAVILLVIGVILWIIGAVGHAVGGRRHY